MDVEQASHWSSDQPKVVVADDSPVMRRIVGGVLEQHGFTVVLAEDGVEAVRSVLAEQPDAVVLDVQMPRLSGFVAARLLKDGWETAEIPVLFLTSLETATDRYWARLAGGEEFLSKDFEPMELVAAVRTVLARADEARRGRERIKADPVDMTDEDVFASMGELLDRKLFEAQVTTDVSSIAAEVVGFEETVARVLEVVSSVVDCDVAALLMLDDKAAYVAVEHEVSHEHYRDLFAALADAASKQEHRDIDVTDLVPRLADPHRHLGADDEAHLETVLTMPLRARDRVVALLGMSSARRNAFGETSLTTLRLVESPMALVVDNARLYRGDGAPQD